MLCYRAQYYGIPVRIRLMVMDIILLTEPQHVSQLFGQSQDLSNKVYRNFVSKTFGVPQKFQDFFAADDSGLSRVPRPQSNVKPEHRVDYLMHTYITKFLSGPSLRPLAGRFTDNLVQRLEKLDVANQALSIPDLYGFLQDHFFRASVESMFGSGLLDVNPTFCTDFWAFESWVPDLAQGYPRWMKRQAYQSRDKCLENIKRWHRLLDIKRKSRDPGEVGTYHPMFGSEIVSKRHKAFSQMELMGPDARASEDLALIWGFVEFLPNL